MNYANEKYIDIGMTAILIPLSLSCFLLMILSGFAFYKATKQTSPQGSTTETMTCVVINDLETLKLECEKQI